MMMWCMHAFFTSQPAGCNRQDNRIWMFTFSRRHQVLSPEWRRVWGGLVIFPSFLHFLPANSSSSSSLEATKVIQSLRLSSIALFAMLQFAAWKKAAKRSQRIVCAVLCCAVISEKWTNVRIVMVMVAVLAVATLRLTCEEKGINACHNVSQSSSSSFAQLSSPLFFFCFFHFLHSSPANAFLSAAEEAARHHNGHH